MNKFLDRLAVVIVGTFGVGFYFLLIALGFKHGFGAWVASGELILAWALWWVTRDNWRM